MSHAGTKVDEPIDGKAASDGATQRRIAVGIGSAAIVAALMFVNRSRPKSHGSSSGG